MDEVNIEVTFQSNDFYKKCFDFTFIYLVEAIELEASFIDLTFDIPAL